MNAYAKILIDGSCGPSVKLFLYRSVSPFRKRVIRVQKLINDKLSMLCTPVEGSLVFWHRRDTFLLVLYTYSHSTLQSGTKSSRFLETCQIGKAYCFCLISIFLISSGIKSESCSYYLLLLWLNYCQVIQIFHFGGGCCIITPFHTSLNTPIFSCL